MFDFVWIFSFIPVIVVIAIISTVVGSVIRAAKMGKRIADEIPEIVFPSSRKTKRDYDDDDDDDDDFEKTDNELEKKRLELETLKMKKEMQEEENKRIKCDYCGTINRAQNDKCSGCGARIKHN